jgi:hypothetical protein
MTTGPLASCVWRGPSLPDASGSVTSGAHCPSFNPSSILPADRTRSNSPVMILCCERGLLVRCRRSVKPIPENPCHYIGNRRKQHQGKKTGQNLQGHAKRGWSRREEVATTQVGRLFLWAMRLGINLRSQPSCYKQVTAVDVTQLTESAALVMHVLAVCLTPALLGDPSNLATSGIGLCPILPPRTGWRTRCMSSPPLSSPPFASCELSGASDECPRRLPSRSVLPSRYLTPITPGKMLKGSVDFSRGNSYGGKGWWPRRSNHPGRVPRWRAVDGGVPCSISCNG